LSAFISKSLAYLLWEPNCALPVNATQQCIFVQGKTAESSGKHYKPSILCETVRFLQVKNKAPAQVQITAEQLLREAKERDLEIVAPVREDTFVSSLPNMYVCSAGENENP